MSTIFEEIFKKMFEVLANKYSIHILSDYIYVC